MLLAKILSLVLSNLKSLPRHVVHNQKSSLRRLGRDSLHSPWAALVSRNLFLFSKKVFGVPPRAQSSRSLAKDLSDGNRFPWCPSQASSFSSHTDEVCGLEEEREWSQGLIYTCPHLLLKPAHHRSATTTSPWILGCLKKAESENRWCPRELGRWAGIRFQRMIWGLNSVTREGPEPLEEPRLFLCRMTFVFLLHYHSIWRHFLAATDTVMSQ